MTQKPIPLPAAAVEHQEPTPEELPVGIAAVWGAFLYEGMMLSHQNPERGSQILRIWNAGCIELVTAACGHQIKQGVTPKKKPGLCRVFSYVGPVKEVVPKKRTLRVRSPT